MRNELEANFLILPGHISASCNKSQVICHFVRWQCTPVSWIDWSPNICGMFVAGYQCTMLLFFFPKLVLLCIAVFFPFDGKSSALNSTVLISEYIPTWCFKDTCSSVSPIFSAYSSAVTSFYLVLLYTVCNNLPRTERNIFFVRLIIYWSIGQVRANFRQEEPNCNVNAWVFLISPQTIVLFCFSVGSRRSSSKVFWWMSYASGKSLSYIPAIYSAVFQIKHKNLVVIFIVLLHLSTVPSRIPVGPFKIFLSQRTPTSVPTCVRKLGESPQSCDFAGSFLFLWDLRTFLVNSFWQPFESFALSFSFLIGLITVSSKTVKCDFSSCSNHFVDTCWFLWDKTREVIEEKNSIS